MASSPGSLFEETRISPEITPDNAKDFYFEHGIFYHADSEIGKLKDELPGRAQREQLFNEIKPLVLKDPRLKKIVEPFFDDPPSLSFIFGPDPGNFYALTIEHNQDDRILLYIWGRESVFEFCPGAHIGDLSGVPAARKLFQIPWSFLDKIRKLQSHRVSMKEGGIAIVHPRLPLSGMKGLAPGYTCDRRKESQAQ